MPMLEERTFKTAEEIPEKEASYFASPGRKALGNKPTDHIARMDVKLVEEVLETAKAA